MNVVKQKVWGFDVEINWQLAHAQNARECQYYQIAAKTINAAKVELARRIAYHTNNKPFKIIAVKKLGPQS